MRHTGLPRLNKPFPSASDSHYPAIDMAIRKIKPFWIGQATSGDRLCSFTSLKQQLEALSDAAADYFDFTLYQKCNYLRVLRHMVDTMCLTGRGIIKSTIDPLDDYAIKKESIHPFFLLMPQSANGFDDADDFVHVRQFTVESYKRLDGRWDTTPETIARIRGQAPGQLNVVIQQKILQEGITYTQNPNAIIVWEHWHKTGAGNVIYTYSPQSPTTPLRSPYGNPYKTQGKPSVPFFKFQMEVTDEGWYAPRGLAELLAPIEQYLTKLWNEKADAMTFANRPLYTGDKEIVNTANYRWAPGEYIPGNIRGVQQGKPPFSFDEEINFANQIGEQQSQSPDFGISNTTPGKGGKDPRTATEIDQIGALQQAGISDSGMIFREDLLPMYKHDWGMICQFKQRDFSYYAAGETNTLPEQALHDQYLIQPDGSPDGWNRQARFQKSLALAQATAGQQSVDPEPIWKEVLNSYDGRMALKAFVPSNLKGASEYEDQASEILLLTAMPPFPVTVQPQQDQATRIKCIVDWMHAAGAMGVPVQPSARALVQQNLMQRLQILQKQNPQAAAQIKQMLQQMETAPMQPQGQPAGSPQMGAQPPTPDGSAQGGTPKESISINYKDAPEDIKRQMEVAAGFKPSMLPPPAPEQPNKQK